MKNNTAETSAESPIRVLLVDDDEESWLITRRILASVSGTQYQLDWVPTYADGLTALCESPYDVALIDYWLDNGHDGLELVRAVQAQSCVAPLIMLTGMAQNDADVQAIQAGAEDYLDKNELTAPVLERAIRYARERHRLRQALQDRATQLQELAVELTQAEQAERQRIAQLLHDHLQQMLVAAKMRVEMLDREAETRLGEPRPFADVLDLLRQILEASRTLTMELSPPILHDAGLAAAVDWLGRWMLEKHGLSVTVRHAQAVDPLSDATRTLLFHAVRELLFNVVKHARVRQATVTLERCGDEVCARVEDRGAGFDAQQVEADAWTRAGFGLLSLRERIGPFGGDMRVTSTVGQGSCIELRCPAFPTRSRNGAARLPRVNGSTPAPAKHAEVEPPSADGPREQPHIRVVLADDHKIVREGLAGLLRQQADIEVVGEAADGEEAANLARELHPDVVVMDVSMPRVNGIEATRLIHREQPDVRIIGLSMHGEHEMADAMRDAGATAFVSKGGPAELLIDRVRAKT